MICNIRFNHNHGGTDLVWRLFVDGKENLCSSVHINCPTWTSQEIVEGQAKFNITCTAKNVIFSEDRKTAEIF